MVLYQNIILCGRQDVGNAWKCSTAATTYDQISRALVASGTSSTHLVWQNKGNWSDRFMVIYVFLLAGESWNNLRMLLKTVSISHPVVLTPDWKKSPWMTWSPQDPTLNNWGTSSRFRMFFNFSCTDKFPSIESIDRLFVERFVVAFKSSSKMSAFDRLKNLESNYLDCMFLPCHIRVSQWIHTVQLPECLGTSCSKQARNLKVKWLQLDSNPEPLSS